MRLLFEPKEDKLDGVIKSFAMRGFPKAEITPSSNQSDTYHISNILNYNDVYKHWASNDSEGLNASLKFCFPHNYFRITHYSFLSHKSSTDYVQAWDFFGSLDDKDYIIIHHKSANQDLCNGSIGHYPVSEGVFKCFKLYQTEETIIGHLNMRVSNFELFGELLHSQYCQTFHVKSKFTSFCFFAIFLSYHSS